MAAAVTFSIRINDAADPTLAKLLSRSYVTSIEQQLTYATATVDATLALGVITTINALYIESDQDVSLRFNSVTGTQWTLSANRPLLLTGSSLTNIYISNSSGSTANVRYKIWQN